MSDFVHTPDISCTNPWHQQGSSLRPKTSEVFKEEHSIAPIIINIINPIESDSKSLSTTWSPAISATNS